MTNKPEDQLKKENTNNSIELSQLVILYHELNKTNTLLDKILNEICLDNEDMIKFRKTIDFKHEVWDVKLAKEFLEQIVYSAAYVKTEYIKYKNLLVKVTKP